MLDEKSFGRRITPHSRPRLLRLLDATLRRRRSYFSSEQGTDQGDYCSSARIWWSQTDCVEVLGSFHTGRNSGFIGARRQDPRTTKIGYSRSELAVPMTGDSVSFQRDGWKTLVWTSGRFGAGRSLKTEHHSIFQFVLELFQVFW